jgi:putative tryptophan/tyrosine transport system ATP-binding protein
MLTLLNVSKIFNKGTEDEIHALKPINVSFEKGSFTTLIGSNGSGKTTLLNLIAGTYSPDTGEISINDENVTDWKPFERSKYIARVFQNPLSGTAPELTVLENFRLASLRSKSKGIKIGMNLAFKEAIIDQIEKVKPELMDKINQPMGSLSGGQRQALSIIMSTLDDPEILLLDEPTAALDPKSSESVIQIATNIIEEKRITAIWVTHDLSLALDRGNRIIQLKNGMIHKDKVTKSGLTLSELQGWF